jgi:hypothetical protein
LNIEVVSSGWGINKSLKQTVAEIAASWSARLPDTQLR